MIFWLSWMLIYGKQDKIVFSEVSTSSKWTQNKHQLPKTTDIFGTSTGAYWVVGKPLRRLWPTMADYGVWVVWYLRWTSIFYTFLPVFQQFPLFMRGELLFGLFLGEFRGGLLSEHALNKSNESTGPLVRFRLFDRYMNKKNWIIE